MTEFTGFGPKVFKWFRGLEEDNSKAYFTAGRDFYESAIRDQMEALLAELSKKFGGELKMFRQNRDVRFSADKSPYKTNTYGVLYGAKNAVQGVYASVSSSGLYAGSGYHMMASDQLDRFRAAVADERPGTALAKAIAQAQGAGLEVDGQTLVSAPRGYPKDHERIELLRFKTIVAGAQLKPGRGISREAGLTHVAGAWRGAAPITKWLDANVGPSTLPTQPRGGRGRR
jgi:uncharacterized protein (TIGR02453 family)